MLHHILPSSIYNEINSLFGNHQQMQAHQCVTQTFSHHGRSGREALARTCRLHYRGIIWHWVSYIARFQGLREVPDAIGSDGIGWTEYTACKQSCMRVFQGL